MLRGITRLAVAAPGHRGGGLGPARGRHLRCPGGQELVGSPGPDVGVPRATDLLRERFNQADQQMLIVVTAPGGVRSDQARRVATDIVDHPAAIAVVMNVSSPWTMPPDQPPQGTAQLVSNDHKSGLIVAGLKGGENKAQEYASTLMDEVVHDRDGVTVRAGGMAMTSPRRGGRKPGHGNAGTAGIC